MSKNLLKEYISILDTEIRRGRIRTFTSDQVRALLEEIRNDSECDDAMRLRSQVNEELERTDCADKTLLEISRYLGDLIDRFEYSQVPETQKVYWEIRHDMGDITRSLRNLNERIRESAFPGVRGKEEE